MAKATQALKQEVFELLQQGLTAYAIAKQVPVHRQTILRWKASKEQSTAA